MRRLTDTPLILTPWLLPLLMLKPQRRLNCNNLYKLSMIPTLLTYARVCRSNLCQFHQISLLVPSCRSRVAQLRYHTHTPYRGKIRQLIVCFVVQVFQCDRSRSSGSKLNFIRIERVPEPIPERSGQYPSFSTSSYDITP